MKYKNLIVTAVMALLVSFIGVKIFIPKDFTAAAQKESAYERVMRTGTIRCGYVPVSPVLVKDPNTGKISGMNAEVIEKIAELLGVKVEWTQEVIFATVSEDLKSDRYDALCIVGYYIPSYTKFTDITDPVQYTRLMAYVRKDDHRFDQNINLINDPSVTIGAVDSTIPMLIAPEDYPKARISSLPAGTPYSDNLLMVETKKADVTFLEESVGNDYLKAHPDSVRALASAGPLRIYPAGFYIKKGEQDFLNMLNMTITYMRANGQLQAILNKYNKDGKVFYSDMNEAR